MPVASLLRPAPHVVEPGKHGTGDIALMQMLSYAHAYAMAFKFGN